MNISSRTSQGCPQRYPGWQPSLKPLKAEYLPSNHRVTAPPRRRGDPVDGFIAPMTRFVKRKPGRMTQASACRAGETIVIAGVGLLYHAEGTSREMSFAGYLRCRADSKYPTSSTTPSRLAPSACGANRLHGLLERPRIAPRSLAATGRPLRCLSYTPAARNRMPTSTRRLSRSCVAISRATPEAN